MALALEAVPIST
jgi:hypothetical protein